MAAKMQKQQEEQEKEQLRMAKQEKEVENMIINKKMTFEDIEKLNYHQINLVSKKYGDD